jgi:hypothetical protein
MFSKPVMGILSSIMISPLKRLTGFNQKPEQSTWAQAQKLTVSENGQTATDCYLR